MITKLPFNDLSEKNTREIFQTLRLETFKVKNVLTPEIHND